MPHSNLKILHDANQYNLNRLPSVVKPKRYDITLCPNLKDFTFTGTIDIDFESTNVSVSEIVLNATELEINSGFIEDVYGVKFNLEEVIYNDSFETVGLKFGPDCNVKAKMLRLEFNGFLNDKMKGFYRSKFKVDGQVVYAATTQLCAPDARRAFPCFDEPQFKASFDVTIIYDGSSIKIGDKSYKQIALSNGDLISENTTDEGKIIAKFETSPRMSTYLLAFVIGPFEYIESRSHHLSSMSSKKKCRLRVYTTPGKKELGQFSLEVAEKALQFYEDYFQIDYPLTKLDLLAIPDLAYAAMENWGLITYRDYCLLFDPKKSATVAKQRIATVVAHEIAHQWFGNLVTMGWWTDLWLNEGFASFMQYLCPNELYPNWDLWSQFVSDVFYSSMELDSLDNSHPIEVNICNVSEIDEIFDAISYSKGCSIIRMLYHYIGNDRFRQGMTDYLKKFSYGNASTSDLWACLATASQKPIQKIMSTWTDQMGYPWVNVKISDDDGDKLTLILEQQKFTSNVKSASGHKNVQWMIPLSIISGSPDVSEEIVELMEKPAKKIVIPKQGDYWLKLNKDSIGYYRTAYPSVLLDRLTKLMKCELASSGSDANFKGSLSSMDRLGIQNDYFALCQSGRVLTSDLIKLLACYRDETDYTVWKSIDHCMFWLAILYQESDLYRDLLRKFGRNLYSKIYSKLTWSPIPNESHTDSMLRALVINRLISLGEEKVVNEAKRLYRAQIDDNEPILADLRAVVYQAIAIHGDDTDFNHLFKIYEMEPLEEEKNRAGCALGYTRNSDRLKQVIKFILSDSVRGQDLVAFISSIGQTSPNFAWKSFRKNNDLLSKKCGSAKIFRLIAATTGYLCEHSKADEIEKFFDQNPVANARRTIQQSIETIRMNADWLDRHEKDSQLIQSYSTGI